MEIYHVVIITFVLLIAFLAIKMPVALSLGLSGGIGLVLLQGSGYATNTLGSVPFSMSATFTLTIIPMFILMGMFAVRANVAENVFAVANRFVQRAPGGLGVATVMACAGFAAVSGSSIGTAATMSKLSIGQMRASGYPASLATGIVAIAGTLGVMIPPSTFLVLYAVFAGESVADMLAAGIIPGLLAATVYILYIMIVGQRMIRRGQQSEGLHSAVEDAQAELRAGNARHDTTVQTSTRTAVRKQTIPLRALPWRGVIHVAILFLVVIGGMYTGVFTSTEAAAVGALAGLVILVVENRRQGGRRLLRHFTASLLDTAHTTAMVFFIVIGSGILSAFLVTAGVTDWVTDWVTSLALPSMLTMALLLLCLLPLGAFLESMSILIISVPILYPIAIELGFDGVWLGILIVKIIEIGMVTPPVGIITFVVAGSAKERPETVFRGVLPLVAMDMITTTVLFLFPAITLFLPSLVGQ